MFAYSREFGTKAYEFENQIPYKIKQTRKNILLKEQKSISKKLNKNFLGKKLKILVEGKVKKNIFKGRSQYLAPEVDGHVYFKSEKNILRGTFQDVIVGESDAYDLFGNELV